MSREIKFRGKSVYNGKWIYGYTHVIDTIDHGYTGIAIQQQSGKSRPFSVQVDKDSVGQYTGLKDKNDVDIYEGDIVQLDNSDQVNMWVRGEKGVVVWKPSRFLFEWNNGETNVLKEGGADVMQIIGNIYENPELLDQQA